MCNKYDYKTAFFHTGDLAIFIIDNCKNGWELVSVFNITTNGLADQCFIFKKPTDEIIPKTFNEEFQIESILRDKKQYLSQRGVPDYLRSVVKYDDVVIAMTEYAQKVLEHKARNTTNAAKSHNLDGTPEITSVYDLPTFEQCEVAIETESVTPMHFFIWCNLPAGNIDVFMIRLRKALDQHAANVAMHYLDHVLATMYNGIPDAERFLKHKNAYDVFINFYKSFYFNYGPSIDDNAEAEGDTTG